MNGLFTKELIQAISDWQRGGDAKQKKRRGEALKAEAVKLPEKFRSTRAECFRQIALDGKHLIRLGCEYQLFETLSSWTKSKCVAKDFKGGVPPEGWQGVIFNIKPTEECVILDISSLFDDAEFVGALGKFRNEIVGISDGIGKYGSSQYEVVIEIENLPLESLAFWGGYSSSEHELATIWYDHEPDQDEIERFRSLMIEADAQVGPRWLSGEEAVERVNEKLKYHSKRLTTQ